MCIRRDPIVAIAALALTLPATQAMAADPGRWRPTGRSAIPLEYFQGMTSDPERRWLAGAVPPSGITGAAYFGERLLVSGRSDALDG